MKNPREFPRSLIILPVLVLLAACSAAPEPQVSPADTPEPASAAPMPVSEEPSESAEDEPPTEGEPPADAPTPAAEEAAAPSSPRKLSNTLRWSTASELENFGFDVYRSTSEEGPFERITESPIPGAGTVDEPSRYVFEDESIEPGVVYYYYVESISMAGVRENFTPVIKAKAKTLEAGSGGEPAGDPEP